MFTQVRWLDASQEALVLTYHGAWSLSIHEAALRQVQTLIRAASHPVSLIVDAREAHGNVPNAFRAGWHRLVLGGALCMIVPNGAMTQSPHEIFLPSVDDATAFLQMFFTT